MYWSRGIASRARCESQQRAEMSEKIPGERDIVKPDRSSKYWTQTAGVQHYSST
jgi:hypothetical protein